MHRLDQIDDAEHAVDAEMRQTLEVGAGERKTATRSSGDG
jgi:hypothetical protein